MPQWLGWLNSNWFAIVGPVLIFIAFWVGGIWVRRVSYSAFHRWARHAKWRGWWIVIESTHSPFLQWALLLGFRVAIHVSRLPTDSKIIITKLIISLLIFSLVWVFLRLSEGMLRLYFSQIRQYIARTKAPQPPTPLLSNGIRVILVVIGLLALLNVWDAPDASGILILAAVVIVAALALRDYLTRLPKKIHISHPTRKRLTSIGKLCLILLAIASFVELTRRGYLIFTQQNSSNIDIIVSLLMVGVLILVVSALRSLTFRWAKPSFKVVFLPVLAIALVCAFAGIEPLATYKDTTINLVRQGWQFITSTASRDVASAVAKVEPAVVRVVTEHSLGSGMVVDSSGYVLTCNHVVEDVQSAIVMLMGGEQYETTVVGRDESRDLAVIEITAGGLGFSIVTLGNSANLDVGEDIVAVGYPLGLEGEVTVSRGIVSAFRNINGVNYVQTDTALNPGNSGGPLINLRGEVVGIANFKLVDEAVEGMNFAIAIDDVKSFLAGTIEAEKAQGEIEALEHEVLALVNSERLSRDTVALVWDEDLHDIAREHSEEMAVRGELFHSSMYESYAENCWGGGPGSLYYNTAGDIVGSWMGSPPHRTWLLCPHLRHIGVGIAVSDNGMYASWTFWRSETDYSDWWYSDDSDSPPNWWY
jgi:S1-C subfamily serine protease